MVILHAPNACQFSNVNRNRFRFARRFVWCVLWPQVLRPQVYPHRTAWDPSWSILAGGTAAMTGLGEMDQAPCEGSPAVQSRRWYGSLLNPCPD